MYDFLYIKEGERFWQVPFVEIQYFESGDKYTKVVTTKREYLTLQSLSAVEKALPSNLFIRIHRSYIISLFHTSSFSNTVAYVGNKKLSIGRQYRAMLNNSVLSLGNNPAHGSKLSNYDLLRLFRKIRFN
jgi:DNA-binding LytR/AlgR family response regulator